jgi:predicted RNA-binding Zn ribbon-like protein
MSATSYPGPLRDEPLAIELHNTLYMVGGRSFDGLHEAPDAWLDGLAERLPGGAGPGPATGDLIPLRDAVHAALRAAVEGAPQDPATLDAINRASARAAMSRAAKWQAGGDPVATIDYHGAGRADIVLATLAADAIDLITGPRRLQLRPCRAPGCILMFLKHHPRREWCSNTCGNRVRQARHYDRARRRGERSPGPAPSPVPIESTT